MRHLAAPGSAWARGAFAGRDGVAAERAWQVADESPVGILLNSEPVAVMMATPVDLEELAVGYLLAEGLVTAGMVSAALVLPTASGHCVDVAAPGAVVSARSRSIEGRSGCGLCGMTALTDVRLDVPRREHAPLSAAAVLRGFDGLAGHQPIRAANRSVHAAGFCRADGELVLAREDVGRHCALDKLVGALAIRRIDPGGGFAVLTSRCSFELVQKAAIAGLGGLATLSAPTSLALTVARDARLPVACRAPEGVMIF